IRWPGVAGPGRGWPGPGGPGGWGGRSATGGAGVQGVALAVLVHPGEVVREVRPERGGPGDAALVEPEGQPHVLRMAERALVGGADRREPGRPGSGVPAVAQRVVRAD